MMSSLGLSVFSPHFRSLFSFTIRRNYATAPSPRVALPIPPSLSQLITDEENLEASRWLNLFSSLEKKIPKELVELSFSRSSGPGGQNVNKVNTKATIRCSASDAWIPRWALPALMKNPSYVASTHSIQITSSTHRSQAQNVEECLQKLHALILSAASGAIRKPTSEAQKDKVSRLAKVDKLRRKAEKMKRSSIKESRRGAGFDF